jgi:hypothetical protein
MLLRELFTIREAPEDEQIDALKSVIASKIKSLPEDDATIKALREIEDLLQYVNAGGRMGIINGELQAINDPDVMAAQKMLARYILSLDMTPAQRNQLFTLWKTDRLVNRKNLLNPGIKAEFGNIIAGYNDNPAIKELVDDLMKVSALGQGKGEFGLSVLSKSISKPEGKGDLVIDGRQIEVKTTDGGAGRFTDQEVRPGAGFEQAANDLNAHIKGMGIKVPGSGINLKGLVELYATTQDKQLLAKASKTIGLIFDGENVNPIINAIKAGDFGAAAQAYAKTSFNYYFDKKADEGVLYISLEKNPIMTVYFRNADELAKSQLRLHAGTIYVTSVKDVRLPYPQMKIIGTSR